jgi:hypothetical protein
VPPLVKKIIAAAGVLGGAIIALLASFQIGHWSATQTTLVTAESAAGFGLVAALLAHFWPGTKQEPVAIAAAVTALATATVSLGVGFKWWHFSADQTATVTSVIAATVGFVSALVARDSVTAKQT